MSTSGSGQIPPQSKISAPKNNRSGGDIVKIIRLPEALQNNARALRIEGTITQINSNGSARIQTERGAIDVQLPNNAANNTGNNRAEVGQRLEVNIPAGKPPRQATIRADGPSITRTDRAPSNAQNQQTSNTQSGTVSRELPSAVPQRNASGATNTAQPNTASGAQTTARNAPPSLPAAPLPAESLPPSAQGATSKTTRPTPLPSQAPLPEGANVRLVSVPPGQAAQIAQQFLNNLNIQPTTIQRAAFVSNLIAKNAINALLQPAIQIAAPAQNITQTQTQTLFTGTSSNNSQTLLTNSFSSSAAFSTPPQITLNAPAANATSQLSLITPLITNNATSPLAQNSTGFNNPIAVQSNSQNIFTPLSTSLISANPNQSAAKLDVQILQIGQTKVSLSPPSTTNLQSSNPPIVQNNIPALTQFTPPIISNNNAVTLTGQVTGFTTLGQPLITLQLPGAPLPQSFILQYTPNNLMLGSQIKLNINNATLAQAQPVTNLQSPALNSMLQGFQWGAFDELLQTFSQQAPTAAASLLRSLPNAANPAQLGAAGLVIMAAVRGGDLSTWLGDRKIETIQRLTRGANLTSRLVQDTAAPIGRAGAEAASNSDWRAVPLPMFWEGEIHKITLFMRQEGQEQSQKQDNEGSTRFIFDLEMSRMGDVQLDGLLKNDRLDLIIRANNSFSQPMQQIMRIAYSNAISQAQMGGELSFQGHTDNWVHVIKPGDTQLGVHI